MLLEIPALYQLGLGGHGTAKLGIFTCGNPPPQAVREEKRRVGVVFRKVFTDPPFPPYQFLMH